MKSRSIFVSLFIFFFGICFSSYPIAITHAQTSQIIGIVTDQSGAIVAEVMITLTNTQDGTEQSTVSDDKGNFQFTKLKPGSYTLKATAPGFNTYTLQVTVNSGKVLVQNLTLGVASASEVIEVTGNSGQEYSNQINSSNLSMFVTANGHIIGIQNVYKPMNTESYDRIYENRFLAPIENPRSTFSIDVDTASYSNIRRFLNDDQLPPKDAVRIEEMINYFSYGYAPPNNGKPFSTSIEIAECPWQKDHRLVRIGIKGREIKLEQRPPSNLVFLIDVSGSMNEPNKLPLVQRSLHLLIEQLTSQDKVAIVVYAGASGLVLPSTNGNEKEKILSAIDQMEAEGSTNGAEGIELAYKVAQENFIKNGINRVILSTDGDFNVGITDQGDLTRLIEEKAKSGIFLSVLGFGMGNYKDSTIEKLADKGNGNYAYIDNLMEARKVLVEQMSGTLITIAKDVKLQIEFNPTKVSDYRLIGYENRLLTAEDFNDDEKDAGEIGAGHSVTALYEIVPVGANFKVSKIEPLKYQRLARLTSAAKSKELLTLKLRYKAPKSSQSQLLEFPVFDNGLKLDKASKDFQFAAAIAEFGMLLRESEYKGEATYQSARELAEHGCGNDVLGYRSEFIQLVEKAEKLASQERSSLQK